ncbi:hypothetical protein ACX9Z1_004618 [Escherichia coli]
MVNNTLSTLIAEGIFGTVANSLVLGTASVLLILLAVVVWFTLPERKIRQLGKQRATPH